MVMVSPKVLLAVGQTSLLPVLLPNVALGRDPLQIARTMASRGIVLVSIGSSDLGAAR
jgi:hypothetical protein